MNEATRGYAFLANQAYKYDYPNRRITDGPHEYVLDDQAMDPISGFYAASYRDIKNDRFIIAYRGTDDLSDGAVDLGMAATRFDLQQHESEMFTRSVLARAKDFAETTGHPADVSVTGHSLGGGLAEANAAKFGLHGETFNSYGAVGLIRGTPEGGNQVINHVRAGDPVSAANRHFGEVRIYASQDDITTLKQAGYRGDGQSTFGATVHAIALSSHSMSNFIPKRGETPLIGPDGEARYLANRDIVDHYRSDVLHSREVMTRSSELPAMIAPTLAVHAAHAYAEHLKHDMHELAKRTAPAVQAAGRGALETSHAVAVSASHIGKDVVAGARAFGMVPEYGSDAAWGSRTGSAELDRLLHPTKLSDPAHPDHAMFQQALHGVHGVDASTGRKPDQMSENLAGALTVEARRNGMNHIDHVVMNEDFSRAFAVQGEPNSPFKKFAEIPTEIGIATSVERSSLDWQQVAAQNTAQQVNVSQVIAPPSQTEAPPAHSPHSPSR
jgi:hypothetical protein